MFTMTFEFDDKSIKTISKHFKNLPEFFVYMKVLRGMTLKKAIEEGKSDDYKRTN